MSSVHNAHVSMTQEAEMSVPSEMKCIVCYAPGIIMCSMVYRLQVNRINHNYGMPNRTKIRVPICKTVEAA